MNENNDNRIPSREKIEMQELNASHARIIEETFGKVPDSIEIKSGAPLDLKQIEKRAEQLNFDKIIQGLKESGVSFSGSSDETFEKKPCDISNKPPAPSCGRGGK